MKTFLPLAVALLSPLGISPVAMLVANAETTLFVAYPPGSHQTTSETIFIIGTAPPAGEVLINGQVIQRSRAGHFAPNLPLKIGDNQFIIRYQDREIQLNVTRLDTTPTIPTSLGFVKDSLVPAANIARLPGEQICFSAIATPQATVSVKLANRIIPLSPQFQTVQLLPNSAVLTGNNRPITATNTGQYQGCTSFTEIGQLGTPIFQANLSGKTVTQPGLGTVEILAPANLAAIEVTANPGVARTGAGTNYSRLTPLFQGTKATVTGSEGDWLRLDYGGWIQQNETQFLSDNISTRSTIRSITSRQVQGATEVIFPLEVPVPATVTQNPGKFTLILHNVTAQTDTIRLDDDPIIQQLNWQQSTPRQVKYEFYLKSKQQWGYDLRYEGTRLILSLRHPPGFTRKSRRNLQGISILLDPGHGGKESGTRGATGYFEKDANLAVAQLLKQELLQRGATVYLTRDSDRDVSLPERVELINNLKPTIALSIHYNALPDGGDALNTKGISTFWYHPQAHDLAIFLHNYLVEKSKRNSAGVFWNNLALTRPHSAPSVLLELGFLINPEEFEWIVNPQEQKKLAKTLADGITEWFYHHVTPN
jgi:N-acetylmuramoyl-L-alanine amidase